MVEDDEVDRMHIQRAFEKFKIPSTLVFAENGQQALDIINSGTLKKPAMLLIDINMPKMSGLELLSQVRNTAGWENVPAVVLTTSNMEKDKDEAYRLMVAGYFVKPVNIKDFMDAINKIGDYWSLCEFSHE